MNDKEMLKCESTISNQFVREDLVEKRVPLEIKKSASLKRGRLSGASVRGRSADWVPETTIAILGLIIQGALRVTLVPVRRLDATATSIILLGSRRRHARLSAAVHERSLRKRKQGRIRTAAPRSVLHTVLSSTSAEEDQRKSEAARGAKRRTCRRASDPQDRNKEVHANAGRQERQ